MIFSKVLLAAIIAFFAYSVSVFLANLIFAPMLGYKYASISFFVFMLSRQNGKMKLKSGFLSIVPTVTLEMKSTKYWRKLTLEIFTLLTIILVAFLMYFVIAPCFGEFGLGMWRIATYLLCILIVINFIALIDMITKMYGNGHKSIIWREKDRVKNLVQEGVRPKSISFKAQELGIRHFSTIVTNWDYDLMYYYNALDSEDYDRMHALMEKMLSSLPNQWSDWQVPYFYEIIYYFAAVKKDIAKAERYASLIYNIMSADEDVNGKRVYAAYLYYTNKDKKLALKVAKEGMNVAGTFSMPGIAVMEKDLLNKIIEEIQEDLYNGNI